jgi:hypothetical protein
MFSFLLFCFDKFSLNSLLIFPGGSLQLMSLGDPSLVLNYCGEYWDGSSCSITPFSPADRLEVLNVYERWRLEDFDVVAFSYSPMPVSPLQHLTEPSSTPSTRKRSSSQTNHSSSLHLPDKLSNGSIFFVDHRSLDSLVGRQTRAKHHMGENTVSHSVPTTGEDQLQVDPMELSSQSQPFDDHHRETTISNRPLETIVDIDEEQEEEDRHESQGGHGSPHHPLSKSITLSQLQLAVQEGIEEEGVDRDRAREEDREHVRRSIEEDDEDIMNGEKRGTGGEVEGMAVRRVSRRLSIPSTSTGLKRPASDSNLIVKVKVTNASGDPTSIMDSPKTSNLNLSGLLEGRDSSSSIRLNESVSKSSLSLSNTLGTAVGAVREDSLSAQDLTAVSTAAAAATSKQDNQGSSNDGFTMFYVQLDNAPSAGGLADDASRLLPLIMMSNNDENHEVSVSCTPPSLSPPPAYLTANENVDLDISLSPMSTTSPRIALSVNSNQSPRKRASSYPDALATTSTMIIDTPVMETPLTLPVRLPSNNRSVGQLLGQTTVPITEGDHSVPASPLASRVVPQSPSIMGRISRSQSQSQSYPAMDTVNIPSIESLTTAGNRTTTNRPQDSIEHNNNKVSHISTSSHPPIVSVSHKTKTSTSSKSQESSTSSTTVQHRSNGSNSSSSPSLFKQREQRDALKKLWTAMRQQIFLGMVASSVPVRKDVPNAKEDLDAAGIRFVYFSPQNMKRSKPVAEKIGIPFDWNCAISLRVLDSEQHHDPHRHISNYADWDVLGKLLEY